MSDRLPILFAAASRRVIEDRYLTAVGSDQSASQSGEMAISIGVRRFGPRFFDSGQAVDKTDCHEQDVFSAHGRRAQAGGAASLLAW
jgi:hypothetical protein